MLCACPSNSRILWRRSTFEPERVQHQHGQALPELLPALMLILFLLLNKLRLQQAIALLQQQLLLRQLAL